MVQGFEIRSWGSGLWKQGFRVQGLGYRVSGARFTL